MTTTVAAPTTLCLDSIGGELVVSDGVVYYLTECCKASGKGGEHGVICRACYRPVADVYGTAWMVSDNAAWARYALDLVPTLEQFAVKVAGRAQERARTIAGL